MLVIADYFTRYIEAFAVPDQTADTVAKKIVLEFICRFGVPLEIHSDQGRNFESHLLAEVCSLLGMVKTRTTPYHPASNGLVERFNKTLANMIRSYVDSAGRDWDLFLPVLCAAYRATEHPSTGFTPNFMMFGREVVLPPDLIFPRERPQYNDSPDFVDDLRNKLQDCYGQARENLRRASVSQGRYHDTRIVQNRYKVGDLVLKIATKKHKLTVPWEGPFVIDKVLGDCLYTIAGKQKTYATHHNRLKPYTSSVIPRLIIRRRRSNSE